MSFNIEKIQELFNNTDIKNDEDIKKAQLQKIPCIWDADGDKKFSSGDVTEYINKNHGNLNNDQRNKVIDTLKEEFAKNIQYTKENVILLSLNVVEVIKNVKSQQSSGTNNLMNMATEFINNKEKNTKRILSLAQSKGYKSNLSIKNSQIKNQYYTGGLYDIEFSGLDVTVKNQSTGKTHKLNLYLLLDNMSDKEIVNFLLYIQKQPGEVLEDLAIEMDDILSPTGRDMHVRDNQAFVAGGYYSPSSDSMVTSSGSLVHELGHAVDYSGKINTSSTANNKKFMATFKKELENYKKAGNVQFNYDDEKTWKSGDEYNYCTANERELFAESYKLAMTGNCRSKNVITKYFPETFKLALEIIKETRQKSDLERRYTPQREMITNLVNTLRK